MTTKLKKIDKIQYEYKCNICSKRFFEKSLLQQHKKIHKNTTYNCNLCTYLGKTAKLLRSHVKKVHMEPTIPCNVCGKMFHFESNLRKHLLVHSGDKPYKCKVCGKSFNSTYSLGSHKLIHQNLKPFQCNICNYACRDSSTLRKHKDRHVGKVKRYQCELCPKLFNANVYLKMHMDEKHLGVNVHTITCDVCGKMFKNNSTLNTHVKRIHDRQYECKCAICGVICMDKGNLKTHMMCHVDIRPYACKFKGCEKKFKCMGDLKKHTILHYPEQQYKCFCGRLFARKGRFNDHMKRHEEKPSQCDMCGDSFDKKSQIAVHIAKKHNGRRYTCDICGFQTNKKIDIVTHIKNGCYNNRCEICGRTFKNVIWFKKHISKCSSEYKTEPLLKRNSVEEIDIKKEIENLEDMDLFEVEKEEILSDIEEYDNHKINEHSKNSEENLTEVNNFHDKTTVINNDEDLIEKIKRIKVTVKIDQKAKENAEKHIQKLVEKSTRKGEMEVLEETRRMYNKRIKKAIKNKPNKGPIIKFMKIKSNTNNNEEEINQNNESRNNDSESIINDAKDNDKEKDNNDNEVGRNKKLKINTHQCYVCFKLFETKAKLIDHCKVHFDICCNVMLKKCPLCDYVTRLNLSRHMLLIHKINIKLPFPRFKDKKHNNDGSRYYYDVKNKNINKIEIIPSVKNLNKLESIKIDKKRRVDKDLSVDKKKLVKKGNEWIIEGEKIKKEDYLLPEFNTEELIKIKEHGDDYLSRLKKLSRIAKVKGKRILFPCESCEKICQTLSALKLHTRKHDPDAKPFKSKIWRHKLNEKKDKRNEEKDIKKDINPNRYEKPKPIVNKHKCDDSLKEFYENNIKGGDIEFWQFLKIYNKMSRENITEFSELNNRTDFGIHYEEPKEKKKIEKELQKKKIKNTPKFSRVVKISKKLYLKRMELKNKLREKINAGS